VAGSQTADDRRHHVHIRIGAIVESVSLWHFVILLLPLAIIGVYFWMMVRILNKAGYSGWWSLLMAVPLVNIVMVWVFAFSDWPALKARI
jgi:uncharacterized membrane protein YhaH (DUF805 family)